MRFSSNGRKPVKSPPKPGKQKLLAPQELGQRIREAREGKHVSRLILSYQLGCAPTLVQKWEEGLCWPRIPDLLQLARCLGKPLDYFLHGVDGLTFEEMALELGVLSESDMLQVRSAMHERWSGALPYDYPDPERDGITEKVRDERRARFDGIHFTTRRASAEGGTEE